jgi:malonyl-ACP decarboxylase
MIKSNNFNDIIVSGIGITSNVGQGKKEFTNALLNGVSNFSILQRPGRVENETSYLGAEITEINYPDLFPKSLVRTASLSANIALITLIEAWNDANLKDYNPERIGLIVGGSNFQQRHLYNQHVKYQNRFNFLTPTYGFTFFDTDLSALCSEYFNIKGPVYTVGGASASGQLAIIEACKNIEADQVDICLVLGPMMDLSAWELQGFKALGALGSEKYFNSPQKSCRPFDKDRDGFIYGENCGALVIEKNGLRNSIEPYAKIAGWALTMDANRNPNPSIDGELNVIRKVLNNAGKKNIDIDYINPHGTGSPQGDDTELKALKTAGLKDAYINTTKSIIGHGLTSAGSVEVIATLLQMQELKLHPCLNLENPINSSFNWVRDKSIEHKISNAVKLSMGFGGINTALCLERI